jgi:hypothetical protein
MNENQISGDLRIPNRVWIEVHNGDDDARDVIIEMEDGVIYTAVFVTIPFIRRQMQLMYEVCTQIPDTAPARFALIDTPHIVLENLNRETIEDTLDNVLAMEVFSSIFTRVTEDAEDVKTETTGNGRRATQEVAAVVLSDVLVVEE